MTRIEGTIEKKKKLTTKTGKTMYVLTVAGKNYSGFADQVPDGINEGDEISFDYEQKGDYLNIKGKLTKLSGSVTPKEISMAPVQEPPVREQRITFLSLLHTAAILLNGVEGVPVPDEAVWNIAKKWEEQGKNEGRW